MHVVGLETEDGGHETIVGCFIILCELCLLCLSYIWPSLQYPDSILR